MSQTIEQATLTQDQIKIRNTEMDMARSPTTTRPSSVRAGH